MSVRIHVPAQAQHTCHGVGAVARGRSWVFLLPSVLLEAGCLVYSGSLICHCMRWLAQELPEFSRQHILSCSEGSGIVDAHDHTQLLNGSEDLNSDLHGCTTNSTLRAISKAIKTFLKNSMKTSGHHDKKSDTLRFLAENRPLGTRLLHPPSNIKSDQRRFFF